MMARPWSLPGHSFSAAWEHSAQGVLPGYIYVDQSTYEEHRGPGAYDIQKDRLGMKTLTTSPVPLIVP